MPRTSIDNLIERRRREADRDGERFVDLEVTLVDDKTSAVLVAAGGVWDRRAREYTDALPARSRVLGVHEGQLEPARWFASWFKDHVAGRAVPPSERVYSCMFGGGQRSGKTWFGVATAVVYAVGIPGSIVWIVSPAERDHEEVQDYLSSFLHRDWYTELGAPWYRYKLANGSKIVLRTAHNPDKLKKGDADYVVQNEAQQQKERAFAILRGRIAHAGGLVTVCANPPEDAMGQWVGDFAIEAQEGLRQAKFFQFDPMDNPYIDHGPLLAMAKEFDQRTFDTEVRGLFLGERNAALYNWTRQFNERVPPDDTPEITQEVLRRLEGHDFDRVVGVDVQRYPFMASAEFRFWENPLATSDIARIEWCWMWCTSSLLLRAADEADLANAWLDLGWDPERTLIVCDASGEWQFAERDPTKVKLLREKVKGRGSFDVFRQMGFKHVVKPDRDSEKNPDVAERFRAATSRIATKAVGPYGQHFLFSDPRNKDLNKAIRSLTVRNGRPDRHSQWSHGCDAFTYPPHRLFPRRIKSKPEIKVVERFDRGRKMRGEY